MYWQYKKRGIIAMQQCPQSLRITLEQGWQGSQGLEAWFRSSIRRLLLSLLIPNGPRHLRTTGRIQE